jgi:hypothetical protein
LAIDIQCSGGPHARLLEDSHRSGLAPVDGGPHSIPPVERDGDDREIGPLRKLSGDQPTCHGRRDIPLVHRDDLPAIAQRAIPIFGRNLAVAAPLAKWVSSGSVDRLGL